MKVFITGATGAIGSVVAEVLQKRGHTIIGLARSERSAETLRSKGYEVHRGDLSDADSLTAGVHRADAVIHAGMPSPLDTSMEEVMKIVGISLQGLVAGLRDSGKPFIVTSGTGAYGDTGTVIVDEESPTAANGQMGPVGQMEMTARTAHEQLGFRGFVIRPSIVYGRGGTGPVRMMIRALNQIGYAGYIPGEHALSFVHVDDLAELYALVLENAKAGELFNAVSEIVPTKNLIASASIAAGIEGEPRQIKPEDVQSFGFVGMYLGGNMRVSAEKARKTLNWNPIQPSILTDLTTEAYRM